MVRESADRTDGQLLTAFVRDRDADAFAVLVRRHGPMVLGVARRVIGEPHTADDAFQAVFLVLARRAGAVRPREQVGNWLYGVAYRTAMKARAVLARRRSREKQVDTMPETPAKNTRGLTALGSPEWSDLQPVIDEELARLPDKLRLPVVLCDLEGRPQRAVAKQLGVAPATLAARLASARRLLATRLGRRGISLSGGALAVVLGERASATMVAHALADSTVRAAEAIAAGTATSGLTGLVSAHALQLCEGVMRMMLLTKLKTAGLCALVALTLTGGLGLTQARGGDQEKGREGQKATTRSPAPTVPFSRADSDREFLRRLCLDLTGTLPSRVEMQYFTADADANKRAKVMDWLIASDAVKAYLAKKLNVPVERGVVLFAEWVQALDHSGAVKLNIRLDPTVRLSDVEGVEVLGRGKLVLNEAHVEVPNPALGEGIADYDGDGLLDLFLVQPNTRKYTVKFKTDPKQPAPVQEYQYFYDKSVLVSDIDVVESDAEFLKRAIQAARGTAPTLLESKYFSEDKDPKKREKLLDTLLKDAAVAKKLGDEWKKKMLESPALMGEYRIKVRGEGYFKLAIQKPDKFEKLVGELIAAKKSDEQILEAITLAAASRLPTAEEKKALLAVIGTLSDKKTAWAAIAKALVPAK